ncbi:glycerate kinase [Ornithinimicrobium cryptoxanthini]|uniref:glycerate kinase n=1 Tax=Ornithinimicrobium cryptoxanthini TaxID=2934161 RepID=UPI0021194825|nr:glycerate kinase [Ornithinimicrobium cryptoxanthini]
MTRALRVVVAPDKFKGTLAGPEAAAAMAAGVRQVVPDAVVEQVPLADGGEGTVQAVLAAGGTRHTCTGEGPLGDPVEAEFALLDGHEERGAAKRDATAVLEAAQVCGLQLLDPTPATALSASSAGVGDLVRAAWAAGATRIVIGLGGVACTDGGTGLATALGAQFLDASGSPVRAGGGGLRDVASVLLDGLDPRIAQTTFVAATDVTNPLLGPAGAAAVYAPQKGAGPAEVRTLERGLATVSELVEGAAADQPGAGAAGGLGWGLVTFLGATIEPGGDLIMDLTGMEAAVAGADLVITGEGKLDGQSRFGKGPVALAALAARHEVPVIAVAGLVESVGPEELGLSSAWSLVGTVGAEAALSRPAQSLTDVTARAVRAWLEDTS